jgi:hypothetical protein
MRRFVFVSVAVAMFAGTLAFLAPTSGQADGEASPIYGVKIPAGFREWSLINVAHEAGNLNDFRVVLGNAIAMKAFQDGTLPFPDGTFIARLAWKYVPPDENNAVFGRVQSFVTGAPTNLEFMDGFFKRCPEAWPTGTAVKLGFRGEQGQIAPGAREGPCPLFVVEGTRERTLARRQPQHGKLVRLQQLFPLRIGMRNLEFPCCPRPQCQPQLRQADEAESTDACEENLSSCQQDLSSLLFERDDFHRLDDITQRTANLLRCV